MTIFTKPIEKKSEKVPLPLSEDNKGVNFPSHNNALNPADSDVETESMVFRSRRGVSASKTIFLFMSAICVMLMGILGGATIYRLYVPSARRMHYRGICEIPYLPSNNSMARMYRHSEFVEMPQLRQLFPEIFGNGSAVSGLNGMKYDHQIDDEEFFREDIELEDNSDESYSKIEVPQFKDSRRGLFMHDFKENQSAIIDTRANRCFVMELDWETTLLPTNLRDLLQKLATGYYAINTERVRKNMRVVTPALTDLSLISPRIASDCRGKKVYMLEKYVSGVFKRSVNILPETGKFAEFSGKKIVEFDLMNINEIEAFENNENQK